MGTTVMVPASPSIEVRPSTAPTAAEGAWFAVTGVLLAGVGPALLIASTPLQQASSSTWVWAWLLSVFVGLRYAWLVGHGSQRLYELIVWLFTYAFFGLAPLVQMRSAKYPATTPYIDASLNAKAMAVVGVGVVALSIGLATGGRPQQWWPRRMTPHVRTDMVFVLTAMALLVSAYYVSKVGISTLFSSRGQQAGAEFSTWRNPTVAVIVRAAATWPLVISFVALVALRRQRRFRGVGGLSVLPWVVLLALAVVVNPIGSPRYVAGTTFLAVLVALGATATAHRFRLFAVLIAVGLVFVFPYTDVARHADSRGSTKVGGPTAVLATGDFDAFDEINNTLAYVRSEGHTDGRQLAGATLFWIPRSVWTAKPEDTGILLADFRGYSFTNLSAPIWTELFIDGGWPMLILGMGLLGWGVRRLDNNAVLATRHGSGRGVIATILPFYLVLLLRGSLLQAMAGFLVIVLCGTVVRCRSRSLSTPRLPTLPQLSRAEAVED